MIHQTEMVIGISIPRPVDLERAGGLAAIGVAQVREDAAVLSLELLDRVKRPGAAAIAVAAAPVVSMLRLIGSIIGALLDHCHGRCVRLEAPDRCTDDR